MFISNAGAFLTFSCILLFSVTITCQRFENSCGDTLTAPFQSVSQPKKDRFLVLGTNDNKAAGLGNILTFFPSLFYYSIFSERRIVLYEKGLLGKFCQVVKCASPFVAEMAPLYPDVFTEYNIFHQRILSAKDFLEIANGRQETHEEDIIVTSTGIDGKSEWWIHFENLTRCVSRVSGCTVGDIACSERYAYQTLIQGPFHAHVLPSIVKNVTGLPPTVLHALLTSLPRAYAPRFDLAIHIRNQFKSFESGEMTDTEEANAWIAGEDAKEFTGKLVPHVGEFLQQIAKKRRQNTYGTNSNFSDNFRVYLSADSGTVKTFIAKTLQESEDLRRFPVTYVMISNVTLRHVKHIPDSEPLQLHHDSSFPLTVFDWYALSLSNTILTYRKGVTKGVSTFVVSAGRVSGTRERTNVEEGTSVATQSFHYHRDRGGRLVLARVWTYSNFDFNN